MFELADYAAFIIATFGGIAIGRRMRPKPPAPLKPQCSCRHGYGHHENGLRCHARTSEYLNHRDVWVDCTCQRYDGPDPALFGLDAP
jgi:hypothetical protein